MHSPAVSVVVPACAGTRWAETVRGAPGDAEVVVVTERADGAAAARARELRPDAVVLPRTRDGRGNALACGFAAVTGEIVAVGGDEGPLVHALRTGADVARGTASGAPRGARDAVVTRLATLALHGHTDPGSRRLAFWADLLPLLALPSTGSPASCWGDGEEIDTLLTCRLVRAGLRVADVATHGAPTVDRHVARALWREARGPRRTAPRTHEPVIDLPHPREASEMV